MFISIFLTTITVFYFETIQLIKRRFSNFFQTLLQVNEERRAHLIAKQLTAFFLKRLIEIFFNRKIIR